MELPKTMMLVVNVIIVYVLNVTAQPRSQIQTNRETRWSRQDMSVGRAEGGREGR